ncbi:hypothetical protein POM88_026152 [Heracleum sosnowskyi]|uniref:RNase H type-1 domain-containing protein n=1 Tax=Heracleum sosnowskyi TaxID=360622 RepID=A0AAD8I7P4_9APIA|nr:hypothetical protein POM88_026152 [Heracleum sosnowskyi]
MKFFITPQQSAFIPGRQIQDSIVVAHECFHHIIHKKKGSVAEMAIKLHLHKTFDHVEWDFILAIMNKMGFDSRWQNWIFKCISTTSLEFLINDKEYCSLKPQKDGLLMGVKMTRHYPGVSHILFTDDSLFFLHASELGAANLFRLLEEYCEASGQQINFNKSSIIFSPNTSTELKNKIVEKLINKIMMMVRNFWWGGDPSSKTIHWRKWDILTRAKSEGGMGFRDLKVFNLALLAKQCWRLVLNPSSFWARVLKGIYFPRDNFLNAKKGSRASWLWNNLLKGRDVLLAGIRWQVGNGKSINFWCDRWVSNSPHFFVRDAKGPFNSNSFVADFISGGRWNTSKLQNHVSAKAISDLMSIPLSFTNANDRLVWHHNSKGNYTVKSGYFIALKLVKEGLFQSDLSSHQASSSLNIYRYMNLLARSLVALLTILHCGGIPPINLVKSNCDGAFKRGTAAISVIGRNSDGKLLDGRGCCISASSPLQAELFAIREACLIIRQQQLSNAIIESDCKIAINLCSSEAAPPWASVVLIEDIKSMASEFSINLSFVPRCCNAVAHWVAKQALLKFLPLNWVFDPPVRLSSVLRSDLGF